MSKFYYSGSLEQVNYLSRRDIFLKFIYGKWQTMFLEGMLFLIYGIGIVCFELLYNYTDFIKINLPINIVIYGFSGIAIIMSLSFLITSFVIRKQKAQTFVKKRAVLDLIIGAFILFLPWSVYGIIGSVSIFYGLNQLIGRKDQNSSFRKFKALLFLASGIGLLFLSSVNLVFANLILALYSIALGIYIILISLSFRKSVTKFDDEQKGFTEYTIE